MGFDTIKMYLVHINCNYVEQFLVGVNVFSGFHYTQIYGHTVQHFLSFDYWTKPKDHFMLGWQNVPPTTSNPN